MLLHPVFFRCGTHRDAQCMGQDLRSTCLPGRCARHRPCHDSTHRRRALQGTGADLSHPNCKQACSRSRSDRHRRSHGCNVPVRLVLTGTKQVARRLLPRIAPTQPMRSRVTMYICCFPDHGERRKAQTSHGTAWRKSLKARNRVAKVGQCWCAPPTVPLLPMAIGLNVAQATCSGQAWALEGPLFRRAFARCASCAWWSGHRRRGRGEWG